jgi:hypothetical protein
MSVYRSEVGESPVDNQEVHEVFTCGVRRGLARAQASNRLPVQGQAGH